MLVTRQQVVREIIKNSVVPQQDEASAFAASNIALCKYWGKRDVELNLPVTSSLSISMSHLGAWSKISLCDSAQDQIFLNALPMAQNTMFYQRLVEFFNGGDSCVSDGHGDRFCLGADFRLQAIHSGDTVLSTFVERASAKSILFPDGKVHPNNRRDWFW